MLTRLRMSSTSVTVLLLCLIVNVRAWNATRFVGFVQNLKAEVVEDENTVRSIDAYKSLKLNISWSPPTSDRQPTSYSVTVTGLSTHNNSNGIECPEESIFYTSNDASRRNVLLPKHATQVDIPEMPIRPSCSYRIQVFANPRTRPTINSPEIIYTVPECVGRRCSCANAGSILPIPKVSATQSENNVFVNWTVYSNYRVRSYVISIGMPLLTSRTGLPVYNVTKIAEVPAEQTTFSWNFFLDGQRVQIQSNYKVTVAAKDYRGCFGQEGHSVVPYVRSYSASNRNIWFAFSVLIGICILLGALSLLLFYTKERYSLFWAKPSRIRTDSKYKSQWVLPILQKRNILYIQAEYEEEYGGETDKLEVPYKSVSLLRELGQGQFGRVYLGRLADSGGKLVAVKTSQCRDTFDETETRRQFIEEIEIMKLAGPHPYLVELVGYCTRADKPACIILEYMQGGDLLNYLHSRKNIRRREVTRDGQNTSERASRPSVSETLYTTIASALSSYAASDAGTTYALDRTPRIYENVNENYECEYDGTENNLQDNIAREQFLKFALDIASGMKHLEAKGITHRDLAARNVLIDSDFTLKISDFGLSRNGVYVIKNTKGKTRRLPVRWMSPEAIRDRAFSSKSDIWSFGIVLWEIGTLGSFPYSNIEDDLFLYYITHDHAHLEQPESVSSDIYELMCSCWATKPQDRPDFSQIVLHLEMLNSAACTIRSTSNPCYALSI